MIWYTYLSPLSFCLSTQASNPKHHCPFLFPVVTEHHHLCNSAFQQQQHASLFTHPFQSASSQLHEFKLKKSLSKQSSISSPSLSTLVAQMLPFSDSFDPTPTKPPPLKLPLTPEKSLNLIRNLIPFLILSCLTVKSFAGRWRTIRTRLNHLKACVTQISESPHWSENPLIQEPTSPKAQEHVVVAIYSLSNSISTARILSSCNGFLKQLVELVKNGQSSVQQLAASVICNLSLSNESKRAFCEAGGMGALVKMLESKPICSQELAAQALSSLLVIQANRKEFVKDEKSVSKLVQMLDPNNQIVSKKYPLSVLLLVSTSRSCRKRIAAVGACQHLQKLAEMEVAGAKKILHRIAGGRLRNIFTRGAWRD